MFTSLGSPAGRRIAGALLILTALASVLLLAACSSSPAAGKAGEKIVAPVTPNAADFSTPEKAVRTYLDYTSFAYRMVNSEAASQAATPYEGVRVDSYIELNREKGLGIEQQLMRFTRRSTSQEGTKTVLAAAEEWRYRYFSLDTRTYTTPMYSASYDTTYTLVKDRKGWLVDKVEAKALTQVQ
jgi:hypothetical protein